MIKRFDKYKQNLCMVNNEVYSYSTHVATVDPYKNELKLHGWWSQTTSKHVNYVAKELNLKIAN